MNVDLSALDAILAKFRNVDGALLPMLHAVQEEYGYVPPEAVQAIARALRATAPQVYAVITFYSEFRTKPRGEHVLGICRGPACRLLGAVEIERHVERRLGVRVGETTAENLVTLETVACLGICGLAPAIAVGHEPAGRIDEAAINAIIVGLDSFGDDPL
jgi:NADH:ubiquinone oxidoreductase subunit E